MVVLKYIKVGNIRHRRGVNIDVHGRIQTCGRPQGQADYSLEVPRTAGLGVRCNERTGWLPFCLPNGQLGILCGGIEKAAAYR